MTQRARVHAIQPKLQDIGSFPVRRLLPAVACRHVGPWVFLDHFGPTVMEPGDAMAVLPHPHVHLATVTYLFEGAILHRDSLGTEVEIRPGAINWMTAGTGIAHSERSPADEVNTRRQIHGLQLWLALPDHAEDVSPSFHHHPAPSLPEHRADGVLVRVLVGAAFGAQSPVQVHSPTLYLDVSLGPAARFTLPPLHPERAIYLVSGAATVDGVRHEAPVLLVLAEGQAVDVVAEGPARLVVLGGDHVGERRMWWNFVGSTRERIEAAKARWAAHDFPPVPGETARIELPPDRR